MGFENLKDYKNIPVNLFANKDVRIEKNAVEELQKLMQLADTIDYIKGFKQDFFNDNNSKILEVAITPDFHKGAGIPIGTVILSKGFTIPQAIGNDVNCGMRVYKTSITADKIMCNLKDIEKKIRHIFFEGGRDIPLTQIQREAILREGLLGILETQHLSKNRGLWALFDPIQQGKDVNFVNNLGSLITTRIIGLEEYILGSGGISYDSQIGSIGGGNHFVEVQKVSKVLDAQIARDWGLEVDKVIIMIHSGSVSVGQHSGFNFKQILKNIYPATLKHPENKIYLLPESERYKAEWQEFWDCLFNAANFAFANRLFLGLMMYKSLYETIGELEYELLYDASHNLVWKEEIDGEICYLHRKGACPARGFERMVGTPFEYYGEPVMIPGSMGAPSFILAGLGNRKSLFSASHGAGRGLSRGDAIKQDNQKFKDFINKFKVITPIDPNRNDIKSRPDILKKWEDELKSEAPYAYKDISPIIQTHIDYGMAKPVAMMEPILTVKG